jgi:hypothetical protein
MTDGGRRGDSKYRSAAAIARLAMPSATCGHRCLKSTNVTCKLTADSDV